MKRSLGSTSPSSSLPQSVLITPELTMQTHPSSPAGSERSPYWWLLGMTVPGLVFGSWLGVLLTGAGVFWWSGPIVVLGIVPVLDYLVGADASNPPGADLRQLEDNWFHRVALLLYLPNQYLSLAFACWLWAGGGWLTMGTLDKLGLMVTVGFVAGIAINAAHELGHRRARVEAWLAKIALAQSCYGHFYVDHDRGHHVAVATAEDPASSRMGQSVYAFIPTSTLGSLRRACRTEASRLRQQGRPRWDPPQRRAQRLGAQRDTAHRVGGVVRTRGTAVAAGSSRHRHLPAGIGQLSGALRAAAPATTRRQL